MPDAAGAEQAAHVARAEHVAHHAAALVHMEGGALRSHDTGSILAAVLQHQQPVVKDLVDRVFRYYAKYSAHNNPYP